jgi:hypothetical protein
MCNEDPAQMSQVTKDDVSKMKAYDVFLREKTIQSFYKDMNDVVDIMRDYPNV